MKSAYIVLLCLAFMACTTVPKSETACPPLPELPDNATRAQGRLHWLTVIALYEQCAKGQR